MNDKTLQFLPFHAINEFMRPDFRQSVVSTVLQNASNLTDGQRNSIIRLTKKHVTVPGFRNSASAPAAVRVKPTISSFEKNPEMASNILAGWAELNPALRQQVYDLLKSRNWELLPPEADRTKLPGFLTVWPENEDFEILNQAYQEMYPDGETDTDQISLMAVWLSGRLPYDQDEVQKDSSVSKE
jgi:hypothetical protein